MATEKARGKIYVDIDSDALRDAIKRSGYDNTALGVICGKGSTWLKQALLKGRIELGDLRKLGAVLRVEPDAFIAREPEHEPDPEQTRLPVEALKPEELEKMQRAIYRSLNALQVSIDMLNATAGRIEKYLQEIAESSKAIQEQVDSIEFIESEPVPEPEHKKSNPERMLDLLEEKLNLGVNGRNIVYTDFIRHCNKAGINTANVRHILKTAGYTIDKSGGIEWIMDERSAR